MALIKLTAMVDNISGKLNGTVFARNKGGHYVRSKSNPTNPRSAFQMNVRGILAGIAGKWRELTQGQRNAWDAAAPDFPYQNKLGDTKVYSGFNLFMKLNQNLSILNLGLSALNSPPTPVSVPSPTIVTGGFAVNAAQDAIELAEVDLDFIPTGAASIAVIYATAPISNGVKNFKNRLRVVSQIPIPSTGNTLTVNIGTQYGVRFGVPEVDTKIGYGVRIISTVSGQASPLVTGETVVYAGD